MAAPNYWSYLRLEELLSLQGGLSADEGELMPDELHFIVVHQAFELWFKLMLSELRHARDHLAAPRVPEKAIPHVVHHLRRVNTILGLCGHQFGVMETLTPQDFLAFRDKLIPASGFQSYQMRELEILLGLAESDRADSGFGNPLDVIRRMSTDSPGGAFAKHRLETALAETSLRRALHDWLVRTPIQGSTPDQDGDADRIKSFVEGYLQAVDRTGRAQVRRLTEAGVVTLEAAEKKHEESIERSARFLRADDVSEGERRRVRRIRAALLFIESYRELPLLAWPRTLIDVVVELEQLLLLFRTRHARMVERIIGRRTGTGGSSGVDYLDATTKYRIYTELWAVRTLLLPRKEVPTLENPEGYGFAT